VNLLKLIRTIEISYNYFGLKSTIIGILNKLLMIIKINAVNSYYKRITDQGFDERWGVDTKGIIDPENLDISENKKKQAIQYQGTLSYILGLLLYEMKINYSDYVFIDIGSGKGRALFMAARFSFKQIIGVELSENLHKICQKNIGSLKERRLKCRNIISVCQDAEDFCFPETPLIIYFFQPFKYEGFLKVLNNIRLSMAKKYRHIVILYCHPGFQNMIGEPEFLAKVRFRISSQWWDFYESSNK
jgi:SAM-dependent methyltransferase